MVVGKVVKMLTGLLGVAGPRIRAAALQAMRRLGSSAKAAEEVVASLAEHDPEGRSSLPGSSQGEPRVVALDRPHPSKDRVDAPTHPLHLSQGVEPRDPPTLTDVLGW